MTSWGESLDWDLDGLHRAAVALRQRGRALADETHAWASQEPGLWTGGTADLASARRATVATSLSSRAAVLDRASTIYESAATSLSELRAEQVHVIEFARQREFAITRAGGVDSLRGLNLDPRRPGWRIVVFTCVQTLVLRINARDLTFAATLGGLVVADGVTTFGLAALEMGLAGLEWVDGKIDEGRAWVGDRWADAQAMAADVLDHVDPHLSAFSTGAERFWDAATTTPRWLDDLLTRGEIPQLAEVLGQGAYLGGLAFGSMANLVTGDDQHIFDDGTPFSGEPVAVPGRRLSDPGALMRDMTEVYDDGDARRSIKVTVIETPGQPPRFVVAIPGTSTGLGAAGWTGHDIGLDWAANLKGVGYGETSTTQAVQDAVDKAVLRYSTDHPQVSVPQRPDVMLTGHSQGGIVAANVAADPNFAHRYHVAGIMTAGSPIQTIPIPEQVPVLNFNNGFDPVPKVDIGGRNVDVLSASHQPNVTDVRFRLEVNEVLPTASHAQDTYQRKIDDVLAGRGDWLADASGVHRWVNSVGAFWAGDGSTSTAYTVEVGRSTP